MLYPTEYMKSCKCGDTAVTHIRVFRPKTGNRESKILTSKEIPNYFA